MSSESSDISYITKVAINILIKETKVEMATTVIAYMY